MILYSPAKSGLLESDNLYSSYPTEKVVYDKKGWLRKWLEYVKCEQPVFKNKNTILMLRYSEIKCKAIGVEIIFIILTAYVLLDLPNK